MFQQCFVSVNSSSSRTPLPAPRLNERQPQRVIQTQNQLHRDNTHGARGLHWQTLPPPPQPAAALCRQRRRHLAPCFGTPAACIGRCSIIVPWYFHLLERSAAFTRTRAAPCESDSSTPSTTTTESFKPRALLCEDSMCGRERDWKRRTDGHTSRCANAALSLACSGTSRGAGTIVFKATCGQNGTSGMEQLVAAAAYCQVAIGSANAQALS